MANDLKIQVVVDANQVTPGMNNVAASVEAATARIKTAFGSVENAPEGIQNALLVLQNQARMSSEAVSQAMASIEGLGDVSQNAEAKITGLDRAMAMATGRVVGMAAGMGMAGGALGRVAAMSESLGPILTAAFPVIAIGLVIDLAGHLWEKLRDLEMEALNNYDAWQKIDHETVAAGESMEKSIDRVDARIAGLTYGRMEELRVEMRNIGDGSVEMAGKMESLFNQIGTQIEKEIPLFDKVKEFYNFIDSKGTNLVPNQGELAKAFGADLSKTLDTEGLSAGIAKVSNQLRIVNQQLAATPNDKALQEYAEQLMRVLALLEQRQRLQQKEVEENEAAQHKEAATEAERAAKKQEQLDREAARLKHEQIIAELNDAERAVREQTRLREEEVRQNEEADRSMAREEDQAAKAVQKSWEECWKLLMKAQVEAKKKQEQDQKEFQRNLTEGIDGILRDSDRMVQGLIRGTTTVGQTFANLGLNIAESLARAFEKMLATQLAAMATGGAAEKEHSLASIMRSAYQAAAKVYAEVPFPLNIPAAAAVFASVAAMGGELPSAAGGMLTVPNDMLAMVHKNESIIPASIAGPMRDQLTGGGGGGHSFTFNNYGNGNRDQAARSSKDFFNLARRELRKMNK
jgi:flagellar biosynthesis GTPase FlhF